MNTRRERKSYTNHKDAEDEDKEKVTDKKAM